MAKAKKAVKVKDLKAKKNPKGGLTRLRRTGDS